MVTDCFPDERETRLEHELELVQLELAGVKERVFILRTGLETVVALAKKPWKNGVDAVGRISQIWTAAEGALARAPLTDQTAGPHNEEAESRLTTPRVR